jgi:hypothetical protein
MLCTNETLSRIWERVLPKVEFSEDDEGINFSSLSEAERVFYLVYWRDCKMQNGGMPQFITNSSGDHFHDTIAALETIGADRTAEYMRAVERVIGERLHQERWARNDQFEKLSAEQIALIDEGLLNEMGCGSPSWDYDQDEHLLLKYVENHQLA